MTAHAEKKKILLHACCASCASYAVKALSRNYIPYLFFYNPNIYPKAEYLKRLEDTEKLCFLTQNPLYVSQFEIKLWYEKIRGFEHEAEGGRRCSRCFELRLGKAAAVAAQESIPLFATTLTVSPHKNARHINDIGYEAAQKTGTRYLESNFKKNNGFKESCLLSRAYGFSRQNYCGCQYSLR